MSSSAAAARAAVAAAAAAGFGKAERWESQPKVTYYADCLYDLVSLLARRKNQCAVDMSLVPVHEAAAVVEVLSRAERSEDVSWTNPKMNNLRRLRDLASKVQVVLGGLLVLLEEDPMDTGAAWELWKYGWAFRNGADHLQGEGVTKFRAVGNVLIHHADDVKYATKTAESLRARLPDIRRQVTELQAMSVSVPLDKYGPVYLDPEQDTGGGSGSGDGNKGKGGGSGSGDGNKGKGGGSGSGDGNKGKGGGSASGDGNKGKGGGSASGDGNKGKGGGSACGDGNKGKGVSVGSACGDGNKGKGVSVGSASGDGNKGKGVSVGSGSKSKGVSIGSGTDIKDEGVVFGGTESKGKGVLFGGMDSKGKGVFGSGENGVSGGTPVKKKRGYFVRKRRGYGKGGGGGSGKGVSGEA